MQQINEDTGTARAIQRKPNPLANTNTSKYPFELSRGALLGFIYFTLILSMLCGHTITFM